MPVDELTIGNEMIISKMGIGEMAVSEMAIGKITVDEMVSGENGNQ
jgi:hypothetical protein